jgi:DNA polymerase I-like protein with 3'-5' exonuclease and polymerase domains
MILFDVETNGFLGTLDRIHCACLLSPGDPAVRRYHDQPDLAPRDGSIAQALALLADADEIWSHNYLGFDKPAIQKVFPEWRTRARERCSLVAARTVWPEEHLKGLDATNVKRKRPFPGNLVGRHSLEAWGYRLRDRKGESPASWEALTPEMIDYCAQDVIVLDLLVRRIRSHSPTDEQIELEMAFSQIVAAQEERGFRLDPVAVQDMVQKLTVRRAALNDELGRAFPPFRDEYETPKKKIRKVRETPFNPNSRAHIARALTERHGWRPEAFTPCGQPKLDEAVMATLDYPEAKAIGERLMIQKRLGQVAEGDGSWLKLVGKDGRVRGKMPHNAAVTGRCTHSRPNISAVPKMGRRWGPECRRCWVASPGNSLVVVDAAGIDARVIAHYSSRLDGGEFARLLLETDIHTRNAEVLGTDRDKAKQAFYAILYGAQGVKVGKILKVGPVKGKAARARLLASLPGLGRLIRSVEAKAKSAGWVRTLDGRRLWIRKTNAALNTLAQGGAAIVMKKAIVLARRWTAEYQVAFIHDEVVLDVPSHLAPQAAEDVSAAIKGAGEHFKLRIPLAAHAAVGPDWTAKA